MKIGIIGDTHIGRRAKEIPKEFIEFFLNEKVDLIIHTGDLNEENVLEELNKISETKVVKGNTDFLDFPEELFLKIDEYKIFVFHSDVIYPRGDLKKIKKYILEERKLEPDIVIFGHTHSPLFTIYNNIIYINPGTATGVRSGEILYCKKSVAVLDLNNLKISFKFLL